MPFVYDIPASAYVDEKGSYDVSCYDYPCPSGYLTFLVVRQITVQLTSGLSYVIMMGDATGMGTGGSSGVCVRPLAKRIVVMLLTLLFSIPRE